MWSTSEIHFGSSRNSVFRVWATEFLITSQITYGILQRSTLGPLSFSGNKRLETYMPIKKLAISWCNYGVDLDCNFSKTDSSSSGKKITFREVVHT